MKLELAVSAITNLPEDYGEVLLNALKSIIVHVENKNATDYTDFTDFYSIVVLGEML
jgi:hypothetical protein